MRTTDSDFWLCNYMVLCQIRHSKFFPPGESCVAGSVSVDLLGSYLWCWQMLWSCTCLAWTKPAQTQLGEKCAPLWLYSHVMLIFQWQTKLPWPQTWGCWCAGAGLSVGLKVLNLESIWESAMSQFWCSQFPCSTSHRRIEQQWGGWALEGGAEWWIFWLCWKFRHGDDPSAEPEHIQPYCGQRSGGFSLKTLRIILVPSFAFTSALINQVWKPLENISSKECLMFSKPPFSFCSDQNDPAGLSWANKCLQLSPKPHSLVNNCIAHK